jgi:hypothetical protein
MASPTPSRNPSRPPSASSLSQSARRRSSSSPSVAAELSPAEQHKVEQLSAACQARNLDALVQLATSTHGLVSDSLRRLACASPVPRRHRRR